MVVCTVALTLIVMALCLPTMAINSQTMLLCAQRPLTHPPFLAYWKLPVGVTITALVAVIFCYITLVGIVCYKNMGFKSLPQNHKTTLVTLRVGIFVTINYFAFYFMPFIWALFETGKRPPVIGFKMGEMKTLLVALQSCLNSLLFTLPSQKFRQSLWSFVHGRPVQMATNTTVTQVSAERSHGTSKITNHN